MPTEVRMEVFGGNLVIFDAAWVHVSATTYACFKNGFRVAYPKL